MKLLPGYRFTRWRGIAAKFGRGRPRALGQAPYVADGVVGNGPGMETGVFAPFFPLPPRSRMKSDTPALDSQTRDSVAGSSTTKEFFAAAAKYRLRFTGRNCLLHCTRNAGWR
jgi:hypothetical protein